MRLKLLKCARAGTSLSCIVLATLAFTAASQAALISGSEGRITMIGNDAVNATGSFSVDVAYEAYNGSSASDPLGANGLIQYVFALNHNGSGGEAPTLAFSRFYVFAPSGAGTVTPYYANLQAINPSGPGAFLVGPSGNELDPYNGIVPHVSSGLAMNSTASPNRARFSFTGAGSVSDFQPGQYSQMLVLTALPSLLPGSVILEIDGTNTSPSIKVDQSITLVPEPSAAMFLLAAGAYAVIRRPKHQA